MAAMRTPATALALAAAMTAQHLAAQEPAADTTPPELGKVAWQRDHDAALAAAKRDGKPVFLLFQEIPGCDTCTGFGRDVLSHPLLVEAIEWCFVPLVVRNNVEGAEGAIRERYREPSWNNPVVRFVDGDGKDVLPRKDGVWDAFGIGRRMVQALEQAKRQVPSYLRIAVDESAPKTTTAVFAMHCFWAGEAVLGALEGVVRTRAAFRGDAEVVEVVYRPDVIDQETLAAKAQAKSCQPVTATGLRLADEKDQQHALHGTPYERLDLTPMQRTKVHAALTLGTDPRPFLTPTQLAKLPRETKPGR